MIIIHHIYLLHAALHTLQIILTSIIIFIIMFMKG